jgi:hypothetical protein
MSITENVLLTQKCDFIHDVFVQICQLPLGLRLKGDPYPQKSHSSFIRVYTAVYIFLSRFIRQNFVVFMQRLFLSIMCIQTTFSFYFVF